MPPIECPNNTIMIFPVPFNRLFSSSSLETSLHNHTEKFSTAILRSLVQQLEKGSATLMTL